MKHKFSTFLFALCISCSMTATNLLITDFTESQGEWTINDVNIGLLTSIWVQTKAYGMKATAYVDNANHEAESWLISPVVNLKGVVEPKLAFSHARKYGSLSQLSVKATTDGETWTTLTVSAWPDGSDWDYVDAEADLGAFDGSESLKIAFVYTSSNSSGPTWEIKKVTISGSNPQIGELTYTLNPTTQLASVATGNKATIETLNIPTSVDFRDVTYSVVGIDDRAFSMARLLTAITIPNTIRYIGNEAFSSCTELTSVELPNSILTLGDRAFKQCVNLTSVSIDGNALTQIGADAFSKCRLTEVYWNVPNNADYNTIPPYSDRITVTLIADELPWENVYLYAWDTDNAPIRGEWPGSIVEKDADGNYTYTFSANYSEDNAVNIIWTNGTDQTVDIPSVNRSTVFMLESYSGNSISYESWNHRMPPFNNLKSNQLSITFGSSVEYIPAHLCDGVTQLDELVMDVNVIQIGNSAFSECTSLTSAKLSKSLEGIGNSAFRNSSSLTELYLGENITSYGDYAFAGCSALSSIFNFRERPASLGDETFDGVDHFTCKLYVPEESVNMYKASASDWKDFYFIEPLPEELIDTHLLYDAENADFNAVFNSYELDTRTLSMGYSVLTAINNNQQIVELHIIFPQGATGLVEGTYAINATETYQSVYAGQGLNEDDEIVGSCAGNISNEGYLLVPFWYLVSGSMIVDNTGNINLNAVNSYGRTIHCYLSNVQVAVENSVCDKIDGATKILRNSQIFLLRDGKTYTIQGQEVK